MQLSAHCVPINVQLSPHCVLGKMHWPCNAVLLVSSNVKICFLLVLCKGRPSTSLKLGHI